VSTPSSAAESSRSLRDRPLGKALAVGVVLLAAFALSRACASTEQEVSSERAVEIARESIPFTPEEVQVRFLRRGVPSRALWAVSLSVTDDDGRPQRTRVVLVDARSGEIVR
jgi:hypothetical protein